LSGLRAPQDKGGLLLVIAVKAANDQLEQSITRTVSVIEARCNQLGIYCKLQRDGGNQVTLRVSGDIAPERVKSMLLSQGLELRAVVSKPSPAPFERYVTREEAESAAGSDKDVLLYNEVESGSPVEKKSFIVVYRKPVVTGEDIRDAKAAQAYEDNYEVTFSLKPEGAVRLQEWTRANINNYLAIVLNKEARSIAYIRSEISDSGVITGRYTEEQAEDIARVLKTGNLPAPVEILREGTYKP
jgi:preprotein translocase subunit SecD